MPSCKSCGAEIIWKLTKGGKAIPLNINPKPVCVLSDDDQRVEIRDGYTSHFATCPQADKFRKNPHRD